MLKSITSSTKSVTKPIAKEISKRNIVIIGNAVTEPRQMKGKLRRVALDEVSNPENYGSPIYSLSDAFNPSLDADSREKIFTGLHRSISFQAQNLTRMMTAAELTENKVYVIRVGDTTSAELVFTESTTSNTGNKFDEPVMGMDKPSECLRILARKSGDEANNFGLKISHDAVTGIIDKVTLFYEPSTSISSIVAIDDSSIANDYIIEVTPGMTISELAALINMPSNPFSTYLLAEVEYVSISKAYTNFDYKKSIIIPEGETGAYRLQQVESISVTKDKTFTTSVGYEKTRLAAYVKTGTKENPSIKNAGVKYQEISNVLKKTNLLSLTNFKEIPSKLFNTTSTVYQEVYRDKTRLAAWDNKYDSIMIERIKGDTMELTRGTDWEFDQTNGVYELDATLVTGLTNTAPELFSVESGDVVGDLNTDPTDPTKYDVAFTFVDRFGKESKPTVIKEGVLDAGANSLKVIIEKDLNIAVKAIRFYLAEHTTLTTRTLAFAQEHKTPTKVTANTKFDITTKPLAGAVNLPNLDGTVHITKDVTIDFSVKCKLKEHFSITELPKNAWYNYFVTGNEITYGTAFPQIGDGTCSFSGEVTLKHFITDSEYEVSSYGNTGNDKDTIAFVFNESPYTTEMAGGDLEIKYTVSPALPETTNGNPTYLRGGIEFNNQSNETYLNQVVQAINENIHFFQPTDLYVCGLDLFMPTYTNDPNTNARITNALPVMSTFNDLITELNTQFPVVLHLNGRRWTHPETTDSFKERLCKSLVNELLKPTDSKLDLYTLRGTYSNRNISIGVGDVYEQLTTTYGSVRFHHDLGLIHLRDTLVQDYVNDKVSYGHRRLGNNFYSEIKSPNPTAIANIGYNGFCLYAIKADPQTNTSFVGALTSRTCEYYNADVSTAAYFDNYRDANNLIVKFVIDYIEYNIAHRSQLSQEVLHSGSRSIEDDVMKRFNSQMLSGITVNIDFDSTDDSSLIDGRLTCNINARFAATARELTLNSYYEIVR